jgi:1,4-dihydroxy-2-naphthoyl-CoA hydrolase
MLFSYSRIIHFADTDAAGVVYFANVLAMCHEAYEVMLQAIGFNLRDFFRNPILAIPIIHGEVDFYKPMFCGDQIEIKLETNLINETEFIINYQIFDQDMKQLLAKSQTQHVCINPETRKRTKLPEQILESF